MADLGTTLADIQDAFDLHHHGIMDIRRVVLDYGGKTLEPTVACMAIPMLYAHWEGYVKEVCELYLDHIEESVSRARELQSAVLGHLWSPSFRPFAGGVNFERKKAIAELALNCLEDPVAFGQAEKAVDTKSNLNYGVLEEIGRCLCLDVVSLISRKAHLDAFVNMRNNIAHGSSPRKMDYQQFEGQATPILQLMEDFETVVANALRNRAFAQAAPA